ncbi:hypothetical protein L2E82_14445 [Cichorium intybus]|uniref:Uncharacterized protein n=1 Tax=Cichorium intybus TaxID=13427 RepID=A0ACB9F026_CICIN|nr:hypothetical protein L2E82_14445 [Cichorium intybus]
MGEPTNSAEIDIIERDTGPLKTSQIEIETGTKAGKTFGSGESTKQKGKEKLVACGARVQKADFPVAAMTLWRKKVLLIRHLI